MSYPLYCNGKGTLDEIKGNSKKADAGSELSER